MHWIMHIIICMHWVMYVIIWMQWAMSGTSRHALNHAHKPCQQLLSMHWVMHIIVWMQWAMSVTSWHALSHVCKYITIRSDLSRVRTTLYVMRWVKLIIFFYSICVAHTVDGQVHLVRLYHLVCVVHLHLDNFLLFVHQQTKNDKLLDCSQGNRI